MIKTEEKRYKIEKSEIEKYKKEDRIIIDVRSNQEYQEGHIKGAISIPEYEIESKIENKIKDKNQKILLYCDSGARSKKAKQKLEKLGYKSVISI